MTDRPRRYETSSNLNGFTETQFAVFAVVLVACSVVLAALVAVVVFR